MNNINRLSRNTICLFSGLVFYKILIPHKFGSILNEFVILKYFNR